VGHDLTDRPARRDLLAHIASESSQAVVLTEGVVPYLAVDEVALMADDLHANAAIDGWITDYFAPALVRSMQARYPNANAPLVFAPEDWHGFFATHGWRAREMHYLADVSARLGREVPYPPTTRDLLAYTVLDRV
jgi:O-methyltransferase involved in polyketide biosynthesis